MVGLSEVNANMGVIIKEVKQNMKGLTRWKELYIPLYATSIALIGVICNSLVQVERDLTQIKIKEYEVSFKSKQKGYAQFMHSVTASFDACWSGNRENLNAQLQQTETNYFEL
jgi:hypothetical protein